MTLGIILALIAIAFCGVAAVFALRAVHYANKLIRNLERTL